MSGNIGYQILRGSETYDPTTSNEVLLDGQLFYSKKTKELYIGDGVTTLSNLKPTTNTLKIYIEELINKMESTLPTIERLG